jgi:glyoxylase-like metal-dependent hydrolase (beta-lactamase superfamily II)
MKIHCIPTGYLGTNTYLVSGNYQGNDYCFLVDPAGNTDKLQSIMPQELDGIILTHGHFDHVAYLPFFSEKYPTAKIFIHPKDSFYIEKNGWNFHEEDFLDIGLSFWVENVQNLGFDFPSSHDELTEGKMIFGWKVLHTPGHTPGSICLYNEEENYEGVEYVCEKRPELSLREHHPFVVASRRNCEEMESIVYKKVVYHT